MGKINVCAYARVSTDSKDQENSFDNQKNYFNREITKNPNYQLVEVYADRGLTATDTNRDDFLRMIHDAGVNIDMYKYTHQEKDKHKNVFIPSDRQPKFNLIFVKNTSRFARNIDIIPLLRTLRQKGVYVIFLDIDKTTQREEDFMFIELLLVFDENESRDKSRKITFGKMEGARAGVVQTNQRLYGYKKIDKYTLEIIPEEAKVVKLIYELYSEGLGIRRIAEELTERGHMTRQGKQFGNTTINRMLKNEKYKGWNVRNKYTCGTLFVDKTVTPRIKDKEKWIIHKDAIPAIVSTELWNKCQKVRQSKTNYKNRAGKYMGKSKYVNLLFCKKCGSSYTRNRHTNGKYFYNCGLKKRKGVKFCDNINILETELDESIQELCQGGYYEDIKDDVDVYVSQLCEVAEKLLQKREEGIDKTQLQKYESALKDKQEQKNKLADLYLADKIDINYFDNKNNQLDRDIQDAEKQIQYIMQGKELIIQEIQEIKEIINKLESLEIKEIYSEEEILDEIEKIEIGELKCEDKTILMLDFDYKVITQINNLIEKYV